MECPSFEIRKQLNLKIPKSRFVSISVDETPDISKRDVLSLFLRFVNQGEIQDDFLKLFELKD